jgi:hypothetical protein
VNGYVSIMAAQMDMPPAATVTVYPDGPLVLRGDVEVLAVDGRALVESGRPVALCRCGRSALKPLCDGSHRLARAATAPGD